MWDSYFLLQASWTRCDWSELQPGSHLGSLQVCVGSRPRVLTSVCRFSLLLFLVSEYLQVRDGQPTQASLNKDLEFFWLVCKRTCKSLMLSFTLTFIVTFIVTPSHHCKCRPLCWCACVCVCVFSVFVFMRVYTCVCVCVCLSVCVCDTCARVCVCEGCDSSTTLLVLWARACPWVCNACVCVCVCVCLCVYICVFVCPCVCA